MIFTVLFWLLLVSLTPCQLFGSGGCQTNSCYCQSFILAARKLTIWLSCRAGKALKRYIFQLAKLPFVSFTSDLWWEANRTNRIRTNFEILTIPDRGLCKCLSGWTCSEPHPLTLIARFGCFSLLICFIWAHGFEILASHIFAFILRTCLSVPHS